MFCILILAIPRIGCALVPPGLCSKFKEKKKRNAGPEGGALNHEEPEPCSTIVALSLELAKISGRLEVITPLPTRQTAMFSGCGERAAARMARISRTAFEQIEKKVLMSFQDLQDEAVCPNAPS